jgi:alpha-beta hydrolase superfamily lysophospholipase
MSRTLLVLSVLILVSSACKTDMPDMAYRDPGYALSATDSLINQRYDVVTFEQDADYEGEVVATLLHRAPDASSTKAVLYIHGYGDYYFQDHVGEFFRDLGYHFYALELRKYGRSLLPHQRPNYVRSLAEYFADIDRALTYIGEAGQETIVLNGHSTGGLTASLYAAQGSRRSDIDGLLLNSPFFAFSGSGLEKAGISLFARLSRFNKKAYLPRESTGLYGRSIHEDYAGEWDYNLTWKPIDGFPLYYSWLKAIRGGHKQVRKGLDLTMPVLVLHSDSSYVGDTLSPQALRMDAVLDVDLMHTRAENLGDEVTIGIVEDAMHDVFLSRERVRREAFRRTEAWLNAQFR